MYIMDTRRIRTFVNTEVDNFLRYNTYLTGSILSPLLHGLTLADNATVEAGAAYLQRGFEPKQPFEQVKIGYLVFQLCTSYIQRLSIPNEIADPFREGLIRKATINAKICNKSYFTENPYFANIAIPDIEVGGISLEHASFEKGEVCFWNPPYPNIIDGLNYPSPCLCWIKDRVKYPVLCENNEAWMSITPNEIETMREPIEAACGDVLTLGCGLGYYAYMASEKRDVSSVTIIESNPTVLDMFQEYILPQFPHKEKIRIIQADAFEYLQNLEDGKFHYCFADLWAHAADIVPYLKTRKFCDKFTKTKVSYWIQDGLDFQIQTSVLTRIYCQVNGVGHLNETTMAKMKCEAEQEPDSISAQQLDGELLLDKILRNARITNVEGIFQYTDSRFLATMLPEII